MFTSSLWIDHDVVVVGVVVSGQERVTQFDGQVMKERGQISLHQWL